MRFTRKILMLALYSTVFVPLILAQFASGSTGSDGAYSPTVSGDFDPIALGLDPSGDNVFNFTTINIPNGITIKLRATKLRNKAVTWLATGNITIAGTLDLSGDAGAFLNSDNTAGQLAASRVLPDPGPGGYTGGLGSRGGVGPQPGAGPGAGPAGVNLGSGCYGGNASFFSAAPAIQNGGLPAGPTYGSYLMIPLYGGSGGGGGWDSTSGNNVGGIGGAGGGAIRIASSTQISVTGVIYANGGSSGTVGGSVGGCPGGNGSGGAIHLVAPTILGSATLSAISGNNFQTGIIRLSANNANNFVVNNCNSCVPFPLISAAYLPPANSTLAQPSLTITQVNGVAVPPEAAGSYLTPDVVINAGGAVTVNLTATNIPLGTIVSLRITAETGADTTLSCAPLAGTVAASTATCSATFPFAISISGVRASW